MDNDNILHDNNKYTQRSCGCACDRQALRAYDWMGDLPASVQQNRWVEVQFKNTRKGIYENTPKLTLKRNDMVAVEGTPGMDIGCVTLTGELALLRYQRSLSRRNARPVPQIFRIATDADMERFEEVRALEHGTMIRARQIAAALKLDMKIGDVEYQGDGTKAIFYYIADNRVDFRVLIKQLGEAFRIRVEMRQIGARQEAGRIGGIGPCGRALCCASWMHDFCSVNAQSVRLQELNNNPETITGQCSKLKCCINYETECYSEAQRNMPPRDALLKTEAGTYKLVKCNLLAGEVVYRNTEVKNGEEITISAERAHKIIARNKAGETVPALDEKKPTDAEAHKHRDLLAENSLTRFDRAMQPKRRRRGRKRTHSKENGNNESD